MSTYPEPANNNAELETMYLKPVEFSYATVEKLGGAYNYLALCSVAGLLPRAQGYGFLHCVDPEGNRFTKAGEPDALDALREAERLGLTANLVVPASMFPLQRKGWPDEWRSSSALGRGAGKRGRRPAGGAAKRGRRPQAKRKRRR